MFARLGNSDIAKPTKTVAVATAAKPELKPVFARLGSKTKEIDIPIPKDALKYEGILKSPEAPVVKKIVMTTTKNMVRRIACTMRADEAPVSVKEKLAIPKAKSVKFSNKVEYKEIDPTAKAVKPKYTPVFNKPERRLSMPITEDNSVKARLGAKNTNNFTITKNVFNRLGV